MSDQLIREANPPSGFLASPVPQYKKPGSTDYEAVEGQHGAPFATLKDASGAVVSPATEATLEQVRALLSGVATENKLEQARTLLDAISTKDFATSSKQDALNIAVEALKSELILVKSELATIRENQLSGDQKVTLSGTITEVVKVVDALAITTSSTRYITLPSLTRYRDWDLFVTNTLDVECRVGFSDGSSGTINVVTESGEVVTYNPGQTYSEANYKVDGTMNSVRLSTLPMATKIPDPAEYKKLSAIIKTIAIRAATPPTAGAISITLVGWY